MIAEIHTPPKRFKLLNQSDLAQLPPLTWLVKGVFPSVGIASIYGASGSGKSFICLDLAAAIASGTSWFGRKVKACPVVYVALEAEAGLKQRTDAWCKHHGQALPSGLTFIVDSLNLVSQVDVQALISVLPQGCVVIIDTLNRATPDTDENSSKEMGTVLLAAKSIQASINGLVIFVHHTGKNAALGMRGHSSLIAAMDAAIEVNRSGEMRAWEVAKLKDGVDGHCEKFNLHSVIIGLDSDGEPITSCVVLRNTTSTEIKKLRIPQGKNQKTVIEALRPLFDSGVTGIDAAPAGTKCIKLYVAISAGSSKLDVESDKKTSRCREVIDGLVDSGYFGHHDGWLWLK